MQITKLGAAGDLDFVIVPQMGVVEVSPRTCGISINGMILSGFLPIEMF